MEMKTILFAGMILLLIGTSSAATSVEPLSNFEALIDFDENIVAGEKYSALFEFTANYDTIVVVNFTVNHSEININEWCGLILFNDMTFPDEVAPGIFSTGEVDIKKGDYLVGVQYESDSAVLPGKYNFSLDILSEDILIKSSRGGGGRLPMPTVTPTPEPIKIVPNETATSAPVKFVVADKPEEPTEDLGNIYPANLIFLLIVTFLMARGWFIER